MSNLSEIEFIESLPPEKSANIAVIFQHASKLLDTTHRFKFFTMHGSVHLKNLFKIAQILEGGGLKFTEDEKYFLSAAICLHDLGMIVPLSKEDESEIVNRGGKLTDKTLVENHIRDNHHELVDNWISNHFGFLSDIGFSAPNIGIVSEISKAHRKTPLDQLSGISRSLGSLLRVIDELDIGSSRAPLSTFLNNYKDMDPVARWHWFRHCITPDWTIGENVHYITQNGRSVIEFNVAVNPATERSINYWLKQTKRLLDKSLHDARAVEFIKEKFMVDIKVSYQKERCKAFKINHRWEEIENQVLSSNKKVILVVDDEGRKYEDLFLLLTDDYHVEYAYNAKDGLTKFHALNPSLVIIDIQMSSGGIWDSVETSDFKKTGIRFAEELVKYKRSSKFLFFSGTRYDISEIGDIPNVGLIKKPINPNVLHSKIINVLK